MALQDPKEKAAAAIASHSKHLANVRHAATEAGGAGATALQNAINKHASDAEQAAKLHADPKSDRKGRAAATATLLRSAADVADAYAGWTGHNVPPSLDQALDAATVSLGEGLAASV